MAQLLSKSEGSEEGKEKETQTITDGEWGIYRGTGRKGDLRKERGGGWKQEDGGQARWRAADTEKQMEKGGDEVSRKTSRGGKVCVFQSRRLQFANHKLRLRFLCLKCNSVLRNHSAPRRRRRGLMVHTRAPKLTIVWVYLKGSHRRTPSQSWQSHILAVTKNIQYQELLHAHN